MAPFACGRVPRIINTTLVRLVCGMLVGPLIVICLLLKATLPHRIVLAMGLVALIAYVRLGLP